jgi:hypothetical protein
MSTIVVPVYPSQLETFKQKADLLADSIKQSLNIKVSKFKRYDYLASALGYKSHDRLIEHAKLISQADKNEPLFVFAKEDVRNKFCAIFEDKLDKSSKKDVAKILIELGKEEAINRLPQASLDDIKKSSQEEVETVLVNANPNFNLYLDEVDTTPEAIEARHKAAENYRQLEAKLTPKRTNIDVMIDLAEVPEAIVKIITNHPDFLAFTNEVQQRNRFHNVRFDTLTKQASSALNKHWKIRAKFDSWSEVEPTSQLLELWTEFKDWLMSFYATGKIQIAERINSHRIVTMAMQYWDSDPVNSSRQKFTSNEDLFLFDALLNTPSYESYHKDPEGAYKIEQDMSELAKNLGRDNDLFLMNSNRGEAIEFNAADDKVDFNNIASFGRRDEPKSVYINQYVTDLSNSQSSKIHQIDIGQSMINGIKNISSAIGAKRVSHNSIIKASVADTNINNAIISQENTGKSYYSEHIKSKNKELEASITKENTADYLSLLAVHMPELKESGMPNHDIPYHMMSFYDVPMSITLKQLSKSK